MRRISLLFMLFVFNLGAAAAGAQETPAADENSTMTAEVRPGELPPPEPETSPPPGEEVMQPTRRGLRLTRMMAQGIARSIAHEFPEGPVREKLAETLERRFWDLKERYGQDASIAAECVLEEHLRQESMGDTRNNKAIRRSLEPDAAREFSRKVTPGAKAFHELWQGLLDDIQKVIPESERREKMVREVRECIEMTGRFEKKMDRWSQGDVKPNEDLFDDIDENDIAADESGKSKEYIRAERQAEWEINWRGPNEWERFVKRSVEVFEFDDTQKAAGQKLLGEYRARAQAIMTREWKTGLLSNRVRRHLHQLCPNKPLEPWIFQLDREYKRMTRPINEMGMAFHRDVVALARSDQREHLRAELKDAGTDHGLKPEELSDDLPPFPAGEMGTTTTTNPDL